MKVTHDAPDFEGDREQWDYKPHPFKNLPDPGHPFDHEEYFKAMVISNLKHRGSQALMTDTWNLYCSQEAARGHEPPKSFKTMWRGLLQEIPDYRQYVVLYDTEKKEEKIIHAKVFNTAKFQRKRYRVLRFECRVKLLDLIKFHKQLHPDTAEEIQEKVDQNNYLVDFCVDGVSFASTTNKKMVCELIRFPDCQNFYNFNTIVFFESNDDSKDGNVLIDHLIDELIPLGNILNKVIADLPQRIQLCNAVNFNSTYGCLKCICEGVSCPGSAGCVFPSNTMGKEMRDTQHWRNIALNAIEAGTPVMGIKGYAPILRVPNFRMEDQLPIDPMHAYFYGVTRAVWCQTLCIISADQVEVIKDAVMKMYMGCEFPSEIHRRPRVIDVTNWRSNEWKVFVLSCGFHVAEILSHYLYECLGEIWFLLTFILRSVFLNDAWHNKAEESNKVVDLVKRFYILYESRFGRVRCSANIHQFSHIKHQRNQGRMHTFSAEGPEGYYGNTKVSQDPRNCMTGLQVHVNTSIVKLGPHACAFRFVPRQSSLHQGKDDGYFVDKNMRVWMFISENEEGDYECRRINVNKYTSVIREDLVWENVGVFLYGEWEDEIEIVSRKNYHGKVIISGPFVVVWTRDMQLS